MALFNVPTFLPVGFGYPLGVVPAPISDIGPLGPVRVCGELLGAGVLPRAAAGARRRGARAAAAAARRRAARAAAACSSRRSRRARASCLSGS